MCLRPFYLGTVKDRPSIDVPCGKCIECRIARSREWSLRIMQECVVHKQNCMVTLTYDRDHLPENGDLVYRDFQLFMKRLRKKVGKVRFFMCGEYGDCRGRPHFHCILFGYDFPDRYYFKTDRKGVRIDRSPLLETLWTAGYSSVVSVTMEVARYCAVYLQKPPKDGRKRPFVHMSLRPGIGYYSITPRSLISDKIYVQGKMGRLPRYYLKVLEREGFDVQSLKDKRLNNAVIARQRRVAIDNEKWVDPVLDEAFRRQRRFEKIFNKNLDNDMMI